MDYDEAAVVSDDEEEQDDEEDDVEYMGKNLEQPIPSNLTDLTGGDEPDHEEDVDFEAQEDEPEDEQQDAEELEDDRSVQVMRRSGRRRKPKEPLTVDFNNRAAKLQSSILHINPSVLQHAKNELKITPNRFGPEPRPSNKRMHLMSARPAGISQKALDTLNGKMYIRQSDEDVSDGMILHVVGVILAQQYSVNKGIQLFGDRARESVSKELQQLHDYKTYTPVFAHELTPEQRREALNSLIFITEKRCGRVKSRACVDGSAQRASAEKGAAASPTVMNDSVFITSAIDAHEGRKVITCDIPGAFLHADLDEEVVMLLRGQLADLMVLIDPDLYGPYIFKNSKGESMLYVRMLKAMYGLLRSALLFYLKLVEDLRADGFVLNEYDPCVANKMVSGSQMTVTWHVDDLKMSHKNDMVLLEFVTYLRSIYGDGLTVNNGDYHDYLGVDHDYSGDGYVGMSMIKHLEQIFADFPEDISRPASTPASDHLFTVRDEEETEKLGLYLPPDKARQFHHAVAQILFVSTRVRRDVQTAVTFLTTRVKKPDEDDWGKLKRLLRYLRATRHMKLRLSIDNVSFIKWWVDASYNVHWDCKGHTGAMMSLGKGATISFSHKHKLNVRSSTEGELVSIYDALPAILWTRFFIEAQGYTVEENVLFQDNKSTIQLANNGRWSSSKRTKHIKARYFYIKDRIEQGDVSIKWAPTDKMWSDMS